MQISNYATKGLLGYYSSGVDILAPYFGRAGEDAEQQMADSYIALEKRQEDGSEPNLKELYAATSMVDYYKSF